MNEKFDVLPATTRGAEQEGHFRGEGERVFGLP